MSDTNNKEKSNATNSIRNATVIDIHTRKRIFLWSATEHKIDLSRTIYGHDGILVSHKEGGTGESEDSGA